MSARYMCCACCVGDPVWHAENPPNTHETSCGYRRPCPDNGRGDRIADNTGAES